MTYSRQQRQHRNRRRSGGRTGGRRRTGGTHPTPKNYGGSRQYQQRQRQQRQSRRRQSRHVGGTMPQNTYSSLADNSEVISR